MKNFILYFILLFILPIISLGQKKDSTYSANSVGFLKHSNFNKDSLELHFIDSNLSDFQNFDPVFQGRKLSQNLGHYGTASNNLVFDFNKSPGLNFERTWFQPYLFTFENLKFYRTKSTYSNLRFVSAGKKEQVFEVNLAKNFGRKLDVSVDFQRAISSGGLQLNDIDHVNFATKIWYQSESRRYNLLAAFIYNSLYNNENGGLKDDSVFLKPQTIPLEFQNTNLTNGRNIFDQKEILLSQFYDFGKFKTIEKDSNIQKIMDPSIRLAYDVRIQDNAARYTEKLAEINFYKNTNDSTSTYDFQNLQSIRQNFNLQLLEKDSNLFFGKIGLEYFLSTYTQNIIQLQPNYSSFKAMAGIKLKQRLRVENNFTQVIQGDFLNDFSESATLMFHLSTKQSLHLNYTISNTSPSLFSQNYISNHFNWSNTFNKENLNRFSINYFHSKLRIALTAQQDRLLNYIYFDVNALPQQYSSAITINKLILKKDFKISIVHLENTIAIQQSNQASLIALPTLSSYHSLFIEGLIFKKVMKLRTGFDLRYNTAYFANDFMPATAMYYLQNQEKLGDYPVVDFFAMAYLKRAKLFMKIVHINQGISKDGYYQTPKYPIGQRALQLGFSWNFYD